MLCSMKSILATAASWTAVVVVSKPDCMCFEVLGLQR